MKNLPVDVIIPTFNGLPYLGEAIESVLNQTYQDTILYIIDDGSTDKTAEFVGRIKDPRVRYLKKKNGGQATARNYGIKISESPFVSFLDADDVWYPKKLEQQIDLIRKRDSLGLVYGYHDIIDESGKVTGELKHNLRGRIFDDLLEGNFIAGSGSMVLIRREVFSKVGLFREDFLIGEDWEMWLRISRKYEIDLVPEKLAALRVRGEGMQKNYLKMAKGLLYMLPIIIKEFNLHGTKKNKIITACLLPAAEDYSLMGEREESLNTLLELFKENPIAIFQLKKWPKYAWIILGRESWLAQFIKTLLKRRQRI